MIFEMTRDYDIVLPMILAVAFSIGTRRLLSRETIYTMKLVRRGHVIPDALHANMFLVQSAAAIMEADILVLDAQVPFRDLLERMGVSPFRHIVVTKAGVLYGVLRINTGLRRAVSHDSSTVMIGQLAHRNFIVVKRSDAAFEVIGELQQRRAVMAVVVSDSAVDGVFDVSGVIAKEHIADAVARSIDIFQRRARGGIAPLPQSVRVSDASYAGHGTAFKVSGDEAEN
jgi:CIC family chloride channel protein